MQQLPLPHPALPLSLGAAPPWTAAPRCGAEAQCHLEENYCPAAWPRAAEGLTCFSL